MLEVRDLTVRFGKTPDRVVVDALGFSLGEARMLAIVGESGAGKTLCCRAIAGLLPSEAIAEGSVRIGGADILHVPEWQLDRLRGSYVAMVFQSSALALNPTMRVSSQVCEAVRRRERISQRAALARSEDLLGLVRLPDPRRVLRLYPHQLSGGMQQRVALAIAIGCRPRLLICDEVSRSLDAGTQVEIMELLMQMRREFSMSVILVSHDIGLSVNFADEILVLLDGRLVEHADSERIVRCPRAEYTRKLLDAVPRFN